VHGKEFANLFWDSVIRNGGSVTSVESYDKDAKDFTKELKKLAGTHASDARDEEICETTDRFSNKIKGINCFSPETLPPQIEFEALFIPDSYLTASLIAPALSFYDITGVQLLGINSLNHPDFIPRSGEEHIQGILFTDTFFSESSREEVRAFNTYYKATYMKDPNLFSALGYDTMNIVKKILSEYKPATRKAFKDSLRSIHNYNGVTGITSFSQSNDADKDLYLLSVDNGKIVEIQ
jgi:ABC-type branched-subunit amino acid transport system substrate-binding protein